MPPNVGARPAGGLKGVVALAIAISFLVTLAISLFFDYMLDQPLEAGVVFVGGVTFFLALGAILLARKLRGSA